MAIAIAFDGWFQARFATDDDPFDHPRGQIGWTFVYEGEPDFDRVIRFADPVAPRVRGPNVDVRVKAVAIDGADTVGHPLVGARIGLLDGPKFEGHNGLIAPDGQEPVFPLHMVINAQGIRLEITEWLTAGDLEGPAASARFGRGASSAGVAFMQAHLGTTDPVSYRNARRATLVQDHAVEADAVRRRNLEQRIDRLVPNPGGIETFILGYGVPYDFPIPATSRHCTDPAQALGPNDANAMQWRLQWLMGCWDADTLCGFVDGQLTIS